MKKNIALVTGGFSGEAVISYKSAQTILSNIDQDKWNCFWIDINPKGWFYKNAQNEFSPVDKNDFSITENGEKIMFDAVLIGMHGTPGEDGKLQGYFDCLGLPYTSCNAASSSLTFNKRYTVAVAAFAGISVAQSMHLFRHSPKSGEEILKNLRLPLFVKPNNGGSSLGMSKVMEASELEAALVKAFNEDEQLIVEECIEGREFTIGVFKSKGEIFTLPMTEIISDNAFFDFEAKYEGKSREITPAEVSEEIADKIRANAKLAYSVFNCNGVIRIDFIYNKQEDRPYLLEINSVPGQSEASIVPQQVRAMGWTLKDFYNRLIEECF
jgi:D-alanine-D-alanine ligase